MIVEFILKFVVIIVSIIIHELAHGYTAYALGDKTAALAGRLTINPLAHIDPVGSVVVPMGLYLISGGSFTFGWAKPVPFNPYNLKNPKRDSGLIALAGPLSNLTLACIAMILIRIFSAASILPSNIDFLLYVMIVNVSLMVFNLVPLPPLDGSKILFSLLPARFDGVADFLERYSLIVLGLFIFFGSSILGPVIYWICNLLLR